MSANNKCEEVVCKRNETWWYLFWLNNELDLSIKAIADSKNDGALVYHKKISEEQKVANQKFLEMPNRICNCIIKDWAASLNNGRMPIYLSDKGEWIPLFNGFAFGLNTEKVKITAENIRGRSISMENALEVAEHNQPGNHNDWESLVFQSRCVICSLRKYDKCFD